MGFDEIEAELFKFIEALPRKSPQNWFGELNKGEIFLLNYLYCNGGSAWPSDMSEALQTSTSRIAAALNNLEHKGWIKRELDENDGRRRIVHLTTEGSEYTERCRDITRRKLRMLLEGLGEDDAAVYLRIMKKMVTISRNINLDLSG